MNAWLQWGGHPVVHRLGWTLLHFLWQGAVVAGLFAVAQMGWRKRSSNTRYLTGCLALALMLAAPALTFIALGAERTVPVALAASATHSSPASPPALAKSDGEWATDRQSGQSGQHGQPRSPIPPPPNPQSAIRNPQFHQLYSEKIIPGFVLAWLLGVSALSLRLLFSSLQVARLKRRGNEPPGAPWLKRLDRLKAALQISRPVRLVKSVLIEVPAVVGWLRPVILLPAATLAGLTPAQLEAILAHELAHIRRHDYLVNLLQNAVETLLFYHPAVWWVSSCVRAEREICCDEIAVKLCGDRLVYAKALAVLEQLRGGGRSLALGADGGSLLERIRRLSGAPGGGSFPARRRAGGALVAALVALILISILHHPSSTAKAQATTPATPNKTNAAETLNPQSAIRNPQSDASSKPAENPSGITLEIRCTNTDLKVGDEIPIQFIISNHGMGDVSYVDPMPQLMVPDEVNLVAKTAFGENVPKPNLRKRPTSLVRQILVLHPGQSFSKFIPLNFWALIKEPGRYQVVGTYLGRDVSTPITITVLPRTMEEMDDYIKGLTNQLAAELAGRTAQISHDPALDDLFRKLMFTCNPKIVPTLLHLMNEDGPQSGDWGWWVPEALSCYVPRTKETWQIVLNEVARHGLNHKLESLLAQYDFNAADMKPIIERALAADKTNEWRFGAMLAADSYYEDSFASRLIAIAIDSNAPPNYTGRIIGEALSWNTVRAPAMMALARNRTDAGVKALKSLLNDPDPQICVLLAQAILGGYNSKGKTPTGRHLEPGDFDAKDVRPLIERLLTSAYSSYQSQGLWLAEMLGDDALTPRLVALATKSEFADRNFAVEALAMNRTDEGVKTLKTLLADPNPKVSKMAEDAIRRAYTARGDARGRPLRADDFDAQFQQPEATPAK
jgi:beta-lactamase regulating signal transducer with metallopeptidase domain